MAKYSKKEFAELCKHGTNYLSVQIGRRKVIVGKDGKIDTANDYNRAYLEKIYGRIDLVPPISFQKQQRKVIENDFEESDTPEPDSDIDENGIPSILTSEKKYKHWLAEKTARQAELDRLKIEKLKGIVIPSALIQPTILQHNQHILMENKNADEEMLIMFAHKYSIPPDDVAYMRGEWIKRRNAAMTKATEATVKGIANIIDEWADRRGMGEKAA